MIAGLNWRRRRRVTIFELDEMNFAAPLTLVSFRQDHKTRWAIPAEAYSWTDISPNLDKTVEYDRIVAVQYSTRIDLDRPGQLKREPARVLGLVPISLRCWAHGNVLTV